MALLPNGQSCLENIAIRKRPIELGRNEYSKDDEYGSKHENALASDSPYGKGVGDGGHTYSQPTDNSIVITNGQLGGRPPVYNIKTHWTEGEGQGAGSCIDIKGMENISNSGRNANLLMNNYGYLKEYNSSYVNNESSDKDVKSDFRSKVTAALK